MTQLPTLPRGLPLKKKRVGRPIRPEIAIAAEEGNAWGAFGCELIKQTLDEQGLGYADLAERLEAFDLVMAATAVNRRINRGNFSAGFLLMCLQALQVTRIDFKDERLAVTVSAPDDSEMQAENTIPTVKPALLLEGIFFGVKKGGS